MLQEEDKIEGFPLANEHKRSTQKNQHKDDSIIQLLAQESPSFVNTSCTKSNVFPWSNK